MVNNIQNSTLEPADIQKILEDTGGIYDGFVAIGAAFEPYALDEKLRLFAPYIVHFEGGYKTVRLDAYYDYYTQAADERCLTNNWYQCARRHEKTWLPLRFDEISDAWVVQHVRALRVNGELIGYVNLSLNIDDIDKLVDKLDTGDEGYVIFFDKDKRQIYHSLYPNTHNAMSKSFGEIFPKIGTHHSRVTV